MDTALVTLTVRPVTAAAVVTCFDHERRSLGYPVRCKVRHDIHLSSYVVLPGASKTVNITDIISARLSMDFETLSESSAYSIPHLPFLPIT